MHRSLSFGSEAEGACRWLSMGWHHPRPRQQQTRMGHPSQRWPRAAGRLETLNRFSEIVINLGLQQDFHAFSVGKFGIIHRIKAGMGLLLDTVHIQSAVQQIILEEFFPKCHPLLRGAHENVHAAGFCEIVLKLMPISRGEARSLGPTKFAAMFERRENHGEIRGGNHWQSVSIFDQIKLTNALFELLWSVWGCRLN